MQEPSKQNNPPHEPAEKPSVVALVLSTIAAAFGVQSNKNRERDFQQRSILPFILAGVVFTTLFVLSLILVVSLVLAEP